MFHIFFDSKSKLKVVNFGRKLIRNGHILQSVLYFNNTHRKKKILLNEQNALCQELVFVKLTADCYI